MQEQIYDIVVIGSGPSGRELSLHSTKNGFSVALIESELVGGDCAYWSCVPSKDLLRPPEALTEARQVDGARFSLTNLNDFRAINVCRNPFHTHNDITLSRFYLNDLMIDDHSCL
jgi:pyruvate/2-oxoglutarate dehydrogenase complex dihydrolipoamide dehydrogenase (E3) component